MTGLIPQNGNNEALRRELMARAVALGDELVGLTDELGETLAGTYVSQGLEMLRDQLDAAEGE